MQYQRFSKNVPGPFYTTGECLARTLPEQEAPDLLAPLPGGPLRLDWEGGGHRKRVLRENKVGATHE